MSTEQSRSRGWRTRPTRLLPRVRKILEDFLARVEAGELPHVADPQEMESLLGLAAELDARARKSALEVALLLSEEELREICEIRRDNEAGRDL